MKGQQPVPYSPSLQAALDDVDSFYLRLARALKAKFDEAPGGVSASEIWDIVARAGDAPIRSEIGGASS